MEGQEGGKKEMRGFDYRVSATTFEPGNLARYCSATDTAGERREKTKEGVWGKVGERGGGFKGGTRVCSVRQKAHREGRRRDTRWHRMD